jgi:hypothetical protein
MSRLNEAVEGKEKLLPPRAPSPPKGLSRIKSGPARTSQNSGTPAHLGFYSGNRKNHPAQVRHCAGSIRHIL